MNIKTKGIFIAVALLIFLIPGIGAIYSGVHDYILSSTVSEERYRNIVFAEEYPFPDSETETDADSTITDENPLLRGYLAFSNKWINYFDYYSGKGNVAPSFFYYIYGKSIRALGKNLIADDESSVIRLENGYLTYPDLHPYGSVQLMGIVDFAEWLKSKDIAFLRVLADNKSDYRYAVYPKGFPIKYPIGYADIENEYLEFLDNNGISYLNSREVLVSENDDYYSWFYKTDHHWNVQAGFSVASGIAKKLKVEFGLPVDTDILNRDNFKSVTYENAFLGSQGKKATHGYISPEDFEVYYPQFNTAFSIEVPNMTIDLTDTFENTLIESKYLKTGDYYTNDNYGAFLYGNVPLIRIHNLNCKNGTRALMIKTSEANVVNTYLAFTVEYLDIIDPRHFDGSVRSFIEKTHPDVVLSSASPSKVLDDKMLDIK